MTAVTFTLNALDTGRRLGAAVVCPEARYCSRLSLAANRIDRRFVPAADWPRITNDLALLDPGPLAADTALARALCGSEAHGMTVQWVSKGPVTAGPLDAAKVLDDLLRAMAPPRLALKLEPG